MKPLDSLESNAVIEIYREGGIAFIPKLSGPRRVDLSGMSDDKRQEICQLINKTLPYAQEKENVGRGDQRYFRLEIYYASAETTASLVVIIPETQAPEELVDLWKQAPPDESHSCE
ncbi:protealysin inhibitor emfourin [Rahnella selenatireducens]|uniref:protealysin inhibitor emfourin n=1 Tax=Rahnella selenatireducens TaxID=3389797 RepID=UPI00396965B5